MNFASDNVAGASPEILDAIRRANEGAAPAYGEDLWSKRLQKIFAEVFEHEVVVFPVISGTAANALTLATLTPGWGAIFCHEQSHIATAECNAVEFFTGGAKVVGLPGAAGKITVAGLKDRIEVHRERGFARSAAISLSQATEAGTAYTPDEVRALADVAKHEKLYVHMDGARIANALVSLGCTPAAATWRAGVDVLSFGALKNGTASADAVVFFTTSLADEFFMRCKRGGHIPSKARYLSAQLEAYVAGDLWLRNARQANAGAQRLAAGLTKIPGVALAQPLEGNMVFIDAPERVLDALRQRGFRFFATGRQARLVTSFSTDPADIDALIAAAKDSA